jgi:hypothetical protein
MLRLAILRQSHNSPELFTPVKQQLRNRNLWDESGDGKLEEWVANRHGLRAGEQFDRAAAFLVKALNGGRNLTVLVDEINPMLMNPLKANGWPTLVAMLVLAFPEVRWHVMVLTGRPRDDQPDRGNQEPIHRWVSFQALHGVDGLFEPRGTPLFDGYGLRQHVLTCMTEDENQDKHINSSVPVRSALATVLDEEEGYRWLQAYMAYRHGFRVCAIAFWREAENLLGLGGRLDTKASARSDALIHNSFYALSLEDFYLSYPDQADSAKIQPDRRPEILPALHPSAPPLRRFLTVGHHQPAGASVDRLRQWLAQLKKLLFGRSRPPEVPATGHPVTLEPQSVYKTVYKPASGIFTLWKDLGLDLDWGRDWDSFGEQAMKPCLRGVYHGLAPGFLWPPDISNTAEMQNVDDGHSSPGRLLHLAECLIDRANVLVRECNTATEALRGAVLSTQALELLGCRTPTVSVEALLLKHAFEVIAECQFPGVEYHLNLKERLADIKVNLEAISVWLVHNRSSFKLNAEAQILSKLSSILVDYGEYEEAELCQQELRDLHRQISVGYDRKVRPFYVLPFYALLIWPVRWYIVFVLRSTLNFFLSIAILIAFFWVAHSLEDRVSASVSDARIHCIAVPRNNRCEDSQVLRDGTFYDTFKAVISGEPIEKEKTTFRARLISYFASLVGVVNLGILISVLHSRMNRR